MATFLVDGRRVKVRSAAELVGVMHASALTQAADDVAYMLDVADRTKLQDGGRIRTGSAEEFVNDLVRHGFIKAVPEQAYVDDEPAGEDQ